MYRMHDEKEALYRKKQPCLNENSLFMACSFCRDFWVYENFRMDDSEYEEVCNMIKSLFTADLHNRIRGESQIEAIQKLFISYASKFRDSEERAALQEELQSNIKALQQEYQDLQQKCQDQEKEFQDLQQKKNETMEQYETMKRKVEKLASECASMERKRKATVENADKKSRMLASHWKNNVIECFDNIAKYWTFHFKKYHAHNMLWQYLHNTLNPDPNAPRPSSIGPSSKSGFYLEFSADWVYLLRSGTVLIRLFCFLRPFPGSDYKMSNNVIWECLMFPYVKVTILTFVVAETAFPEI